MLLSLQDVDDPYLVMDLGRILELYDLWNTSLPQVKIFYAVKCNYDLILLKTLAAMGVGFDCATKVRTAITNTPAGRTSF